MSFNYAKIAAIATKQIANFGQNVTLRSYTRGAYNIATQTAALTTADTTIKAVLFDFGKGDYMAPGTLIEIGDRRMIADPNTVINQEDHVIVGTVEYTIVSLGQVNPGGTNTLYDIHLRKG